MEAGVSIAHSRKTQDRKLRKGPLPIQPPGGTDHLLLGTTQHNSSCLSVSPRHPSQRCYPPLQHTNELYVRPKRAFGSHYALHPAPQARTLGR